MNRKEVQENMLELCGRSNPRTDCIVPSQLWATIDIALLEISICKGTKKKTRRTNAASKTRDPPQKLSCKL